MFSITALISKISSEAETPIWGIYKVQDVCYLSDVLRESKDDFIYKNKEAEICIDHDVFTVSTMEPYEIESPKYIETDARTKEFKGSDKPEISYEIVSSDGAHSGYRLYRNRKKVWLARFNSDKTGNPDYIYRLVKQ